MSGKFTSLLGGFCFMAAGIAGSVPAGAETRDELTSRQRAIVPIAAHAATGDIDRLKPALADGLDDGLTVSEIREVLVQLYAYAGFPRSLNGLGAFMEVLDARAAGGIADAPGREASAYPKDKSRRELGTEIQTMLAGGPVRGRLFDFAPAIDFFLKDHLFGDIFGRDVLDYRDREIATVAILASIGGVDAQLRSHCRIALNAGLTGTQLQEIAVLLRDKVGEAQADAASAAISATLAARAQ